ncbi:MULTISPECIES: PepSY domain-containing protein [Brevibacterium]|uniref:PepSY domain-containing protein n=1 Tax=Brevibacterium salitolerans TaxID=1403566 RepID=A0ABN2WE35_9MICO|nr:PepSY domain-containing protein [Brevibacterium sp.]
MKQLTRIRTLSLAVPAAAALALSACGSGGEATTSEDGTAAADTPEETTAPAEETTAPEGTESGGPASSLARSGELSAALAAVETAEQEAGGTAYDLDFDEADDDDDDDDDDRDDADDLREAHWSVSGFDGDREWEVHVSEDGASVLGTEEDRADDDDRREAEAASVTLVEALEAAVGDTPGTVDDASLDEEGGTLAWEISIYPEGQDRSTDVYVDAESGEIV